ncbi:thyroxine 5-deiodinase-like [Sycon ciliatum]|uniref:thyroxine 5-deiodinase-like n=1 Tax=Sycon ciliatum TaxID=27933 RepID=UPI0031F62A17
MDGDHSEGVVGTEGFDSESLPPVAVQEVNYDINDPRPVVRQGQPMLDTTVLTLDGKETLQLSTFMRSGRPLDHKSAEERSAAAEHMFSLFNEVPCAAVLDTMDDQTSVAYRAMPERLYILKDGIVMYQGGPGPDHYELAEVKAWLEAHCKDLQK